MKDTTLLTNGVVVASWAGPEVIEDGAVAWRDGRIVAAGRRGELEQRFAAARRLDAHGGLILPGMVNLHHHFYSALARGLDPGRALADFGEVLDHLWWRLDRALDYETVRLSALLTAADCIRWGCTTLFDHHASPSCIGGSLELIAAAVERAGLSAVLCYEITDRNGDEQAMAGLEENLGFLAARQDHPRVRGMIGLHASFTVGDDTLAEVARRRPEGSGCHVHVAEDALDIAASRASYGADPIARLAAAGLLDRHALLVHGVHLSPRDWEVIAEHDAVLIHNPESNANNGIGRLDVPAAASHGCRIGLGTDGMSSAMLRALRAAFLAQRGGSGDPSTGFEVLPELLANNLAVARRFLPEPLLGELAPGAPADLVVVDAPPPTPIVPGNLFGHLVYGASEAPVRHTIARGRLLLEDFRHTTLDLEELARAAREASPALWQRFATIAGGVLRRPS